VQWDGDVAYVDSDALADWLAKRPTDLRDERKREAVSEWLRALPRASEALSAPGTAWAIWPYAVRKQRFRVRAPGGRMGIVLKKPFCGPRKVRRDELAASRVDPSSRSRARALPAATTCRDENGEFRRTSLSRWVQKRYKTGVVASNL